MGINGNRYGYIWIFDLVYCLNQVLPCPAEYVRRISAGKGTPEGDMARWAGRGLIPPIPPKIKKTIQRSDAPIPKNPRKTKKAPQNRGTSYGHSLVAEQQTLTPFVQV